MFNQKSIIVIYVDRGRLYMYGGSLVTVAVVDIPNTIVRDLEVINKDAFYTFIRQWVKQIKAQSGQIVIVLSESTYFEKIIDSSESAFIETEASKFFDTVPFETIWTKVFPQDKMRRAVAVSKAYIDAIGQAFILQGFEVRLVIPDFALGTLSAKRMLDAQVGEYVIHSLDALTKYSFTQGPGSAISEVVPPTRGATTPAAPNKNLPILLGAFGILLLILTVLVLTQM